jgi:hypothetical protein
MDTFGQPTFADPVEVTCRWDEEVKMVVSEDGREVASKAEVMVDQDMYYGDFLKHTTLAEMTYPNDPKKEGAKEIIAWEKIPDFNAEEFLRIAYL